MGPPVSGKPYFRINLGGGQSKRVQRAETRPTRMSTTKAAMSSRFSTRVSYANTACWWGECRDYLRSLNGFPLSFTPSNRCSRSHAACPGWPGGPARRGSPPPSSPAPGRRPGAPSSSARPAPAPARPRGPVTARSGSSGPPSAEAPAAVALVRVLQRREVLAQLLLDPRRAVGQRPASETMQSRSAHHSSARRFR